MKKILVGLLAVMSCTSYANDSVGIGLTDIQSSNGNRWSLTAGDVNYWDQHIAGYKLTRYGYGEFGVSVGNGVGLNAMSRGGTAIYSLSDQEHGFSPFVGLDFGNVWARLDSNTQSYYGWAPGIAVGPQIGAGDARLLVLMKAGGYAGTLNTTTILPSFRWMYGGSVVFNSPNFNVNLDLLQFNENYMHTVDVWLKTSRWFRLSLHGEDTGSIQTIGLLVKSDAI